MDPYDVFGFGIIAYFSTLRILIIAFTICSVAFIPIISKYGNGNSLNRMTGTNFLNRYSLGNLGETTSLCVHQYLGLSFNQEFKCTKNFVMTDLKSFGIIPARDEDTTLEGGKKAEALPYERNHCGLMDAHAPIATCTKKYLRGGELARRWNETCTGKSECELNLLEDVITPTKKGKKTNKKNIKVIERKN